MPEGNGQPEQEEAEGAPGLGAKNRRDEEHGSASELGWEEEKRQEAEAEGRTEPSIDLPGGGKGYGAERPITAAEMITWALYAESNSTSYGVKYLAARSTLTEDDILAMPAVQVAIALAAVRPAAVDPQAERLLPRVFLEAWHNAEV